MSDEPRQTNQSLLLRIVEDIAEIKGILPTIRDHESRIRDLEKSRYQSAWLISVLTAGLSSSLVYFIVRALGG